MTRARRRCSSPRCCTSADQAGRRGAARLPAAAVGRGLVVAAGVPRRSGADVEEAGRSSWRHGEASRKTQPVSRDGRRSPAASRQSRCWLRWTRPQWSSCCPAARRRALRPPIPPVGGGPDAAVCVNAASAWAGTRVAVWTVRYRYRGWNADQRRRSGTRSGRSRRSGGATVTYRSCVSVIRWAGVLRCGRWRPGGPRCLRARAVDRADRPGGQLAGATVLIAHGRPRQGDVPESVARVCQPRGEGCGQSRLCRRPWRPACDALPLDAVASAGNWLLVGSAGHQPDAS